MHSSVEGKKLVKENAMKLREVEQYLGLTLQAVERWMKVFDRYESDILARCQMIFLKKGRACSSPQWLLYRLFAYYCCGPGRLMRGWSILAIVSARAINLSTACVLPVA